MHGNQPPGFIDIEMIRSRLTMAEVCARDDVVVRKRGGSLVAKCPFHDERSESFVIGGRKPDRAHCFGGCGWNDGKDDGDIFDFWRKRKGVSFKEAKEQLASLCGVSPSITGVQWTKPKAKVVTRVSQLAPELRTKPPLPPMRQLRDDEIEAIAKSRGLSVQGVRVAARSFRRIGHCEWPLWQRRSNNQWLPMCKTHGLRCLLNSGECEARATFPSWMVTDDERWSAEARRIDGERYEVKQGDGLKAWSVPQCNKGWPLGAADMGRRMNVLLVEGGPDLLAAYHLLWGFEMLQHVAVVAMLGGSTVIAEQALAFFKGKHVRIAMDADPIKEITLKSKKGERTRRTRAGFDAAARWQEQLTGAGARVQAINLDGLVRADGKPVKDLNDLALCNADVLDDEEIREIFLKWEM